jgi:hypothetical protein
LTEVDEAMNEMNIEDAERLMNGTLSIWSWCVCVCVCVCVCLCGKGMSRFHLSSLRFAGLD